MKLLLSDYVASLKERGELDAILPDLLSELGFHVFSRPAVGVSQRGVDIAAVGRDEDGERKVFLFSVKAGDLTRAGWDDGVQALRPSLNEIIDDYIPNRIPPHYRKLRVVICLVVGGVIQQGVQPLVTAFTAREDNGRVSFQEWNGDKIAELLLTGPLREKLLPKPLRSSFQKAVAMVDQPDISYEHFSKLLFALRSSMPKDKDRVRVARQIYICSWILFVWGRDVDNLDAPYRASELALLHIWELIKPFIGKGGANANAMGAVLNQMVILHVTVASLFLEQKIFPNVAQQHALSVAVNSGESTDINLKMFETLGRLALTGHWILSLAEFGGRHPGDEQMAALHTLVSNGFQLINSNPSLYLPIIEEQAIEVALFLSFAGRMGRSEAAIKHWLAEMTNRFRHTIRCHGRYPAALRDYVDIVAHPKAKTDEYQRGVTSGSVLLPLLLAWAAALGDHDSVAKIAELKAGPLAHCTLQLWMPDEDSEAHFYLNDLDHGTAVTDLPVSGAGQDLLDIVVAASESANGFNNLSAMRSGFFPIVLTACRHYRLPVPPPFWIFLLRDPKTPDHEASEKF